MFTVYLQHISVYKIYINYTYCMWCGCCRPGGKCCWADACRSHMEASHSKHACPQLVIQAQRRPGVPAVHSRCAQELQDTVKADCTQAADLLFPFGETLSVLCISLPYVVWHVCHCNSGPMRHVGTCCDIVQIHVRDRLDINCTIAVDITVIAHVWLYDFPWHNFFAVGSYAKQCRTATHWQLWCDICPSAN